MTRERKVSWEKGRLMDMWIFRFGSAGRDSWRPGGDVMGQGSRGGEKWFDIVETLGDGGHLYNDIMDSHSWGGKRDRKTWPGGRRRERIVHWTAEEIDVGFRVWGRRYNITRRKESKLLPSILEEQIHNRNTYIRLVP